MTLAESGREGGHVRTCPDMFAVKGELEWAGRAEWRVAFAVLESLPFTFTFTF